MQKLGLWREIEERRFREIFQASGSEEVDRNLRQTDKERRSVPGRQVGDGAWEEFDCEEALSDSGEKASSIH